MTFVDDADREVIRTRLDLNLVVEAAAGTGKTTELVGRMVAVLRAGHTTVDRVVAVTFTEKSAGELKLRLRARLESARREADPDARAHLEHALAHLEEAHVSTIHGFCGDLLRSRPVEAGVDPLFEVLPEPASRALFAQAFNRWLQDVLADPPEGVRRALRRDPPHVHGQRRRTPRESLRDAAWSLCDWRDFPAPWQRPSWDRPRVLAAIAEELHAFADLSARGDNPGDYLFRDTLPARQHSDHLRMLMRAGALDDDSVEAALVTLARQYKFTHAHSGRTKMYAPGLPRDVVKTAHQRLVGSLAECARLADADLAALLRAELQGALTRYAELKVRAGRLDFMDLLLRTRDLLRASTSARTSLQARFTHLFVDEFQDTDPIQAELLLLLCADDPTVTDWRGVRPAPGKLFIVGDPKQGIYRFRRADVGTYQTVKDLLQERGARVVRLSRSYRAVPGIHGCVNAAFAPAMTGDRATLQAEYVPLASAREPFEQQPSVVVLPVPRPYGQRGITRDAINSSLPDATGAFVKWLLTESGWTVTEHARPTERVPVRPQHICLLFRRLTDVGQDVTRPYVNALEARGIPQLLVGGRGFHEREEVETLRAALSAIEWPEDQLSVFAALHGPLFAIPDDVLLEYWHTHGRFQPFHVPLGPLPEPLAPVRDALLALRALHQARNRRPVAETVNRLLQETRAHATFVLRPSGEQALANVLHVADLARQYEQQGGISFRGFVEQLRTEADGGAASEAPILEEGSDGVRMMTVHRAKGLEFPVVILADISAGLKPFTVDRHVDPARGLCAQRLMRCAPLELAQHEQEEMARDEAEGVRLAYVAATRARDLLVVPGVGDGENSPNSWVGPLYRALVPAAQFRRKAEPSPGCPAFRDDSVVDRPPDMMDTGPNVRPGTHAFPGHAVVWWDPHALALDAAGAPGIRHRELLDKNVPDDVVTADAARWRAWRDQRSAVVERGGTPLFRVATITEHAEESGGAATAELVELPRPPTGAHGKRYGTLVHAVMATVALDAPPAAVQEATAMQARILGATEHERASCVDAVGRALAHPLLARARAAAACRREAPVTLTLPDGTRLEGVVDLAFREDRGWTVVDFKTDADVSLGREAYARQVRTYADAITAATGLPAHGVILAL
ncbi:MAG: UvrD-helicase domain-containing protein [Deltaproteobacteria bacterium]|nr:UvrD-helicase domain-containing protein [Deltaproteobacteria bacterium]